MVAIARCFAAPKCSQLAENKADIGRKLLIFHPVSERITPDAHQRRTFAGIPADLKAI
jgi:hypothetical protein